MNCHESGGESIMHDVAISHDTALQILTILHMIETNSLLQPNTHCNKDDNYHSIYDRHYDNDILYQLLDNDIID